MKIKIEVPATDTRAQRIFGEALLQLAQENDAMVREVLGVGEEVEEVEEEIEEITLPPLPQVPAPPVPTPPVAQQDDHLDVNGLPWDERIHAGSKTKNQDGTWKARRIPADMTPEEWEAEQKRVEDELKGIVSLSDGMEDDEDNVTFEELLKEMGRQFDNPDFISHSTRVLEEMGLSKVPDLRTNPKLIGQFRRRVGIV